MSVECMTWAFAQAIPPAPKLVLLALADDANKVSGLAFPGVELLAKRCAPMGKRTIQNHLKWLASPSVNLIRITPRFTDGGRQTSNLYTLCLTTTYCGEGAESCTLPDESDGGGEDAESCMGRVQKAAPWRVQELLHGEGARAAAPSYKNINPVKDPLEGTPGDSRRVRRREGVSSPTWEAYRSGYHKRYGVDPVRDATTNAVLCQLVKKFGAAEAPAVAAFYCTLDRKLYVENKHPPGLLLRDCYGIRTDWKRGPVPAPASGQKYLQPVPAQQVRGEDCPPDAAAALARILGRDAFAFTTGVA